MSDSTKFGILIPNVENSNLSVVGEDQEGMSCLFSHCENSGKLSVPPFSNKKYSESWTVIPHQIFLHLLHTLHTSNLSHAMCKTLHLPHAINATLDTSHTLHARTLTMLSM